MQWIIVKISQNWVRPIQANPSIVTCRWKLWTKDIQWCLSFPLKQDLLWDFVLCIIKLVIQRVTHATLGNTKFMVFINIPNVYYLSNWNSDSEDLSICLQSHSLDCVLVSSELQYKIGIFNFIFINIIFSQLKRLKEIRVILEQRSWRITTPLQRDLWFKLRHQCVARSPWTCDMRLKENIFYSFAVLVVIWIVLVWWSRISSTRLTYHFLPFSSKPPKWQLSNEVKNARNKK